MRTVLVLVVSLVFLAAGCGSDDDGGGSSGRGAGSGGADEQGATVAPTACATGAADPSRTVVLRIDDEVGGFGAISSRTPSDLTAGSVRISVEADEENEGPVVVTLALDGTEVTTISGVEPGATCGVDIELAAGTYQATSDVNGDSDAEFVVVP